MERIYFQTHGCTNNFAESEIMAGLLKKAGFDIVSNRDNADIIVLNICTVKGEKTALDSIEEVKKLGKKIILAGCIPKKSYKMFREALPDSCFISTHNIMDIVSIVEEARNDEVIDDMAVKNDVKLGKRVRNNQGIGILPILTGCNNKCAYCSVKLIKGELFSYPEDAIIEEAERAIREKCKQLWVTSQDNACYGIDSGKAKLPELVRKLAALEGNFMIRIGMMNPSNLLPILDEMIEVYKLDKVFKFIHIPVQSGNTQVLKAMNRKYNVEEFMLIVDRFENEIPGITISTDIICGFPGETEEQFKDSLNLISDIKPDVLNISRFVARKYTRSYYMDNQVHGNISKEWSRQLTELHNNVGKLNNEKWIGWKGPVIIDEKNIQHGNYNGRNFAYKTVVVESDEDILNQFVNVKITKAKSHYLIGELIK
ncbi:tRNA (N(6)-L-threonylcarbamoyladenosine(37)-C(2))-methylthiotransferase [Candidatus Woesearchaeota archaeon]|nr:tRNA (N(6)-L-threonylcarbamoyladenosine(37)-C(2))-methylthiotransferase [Candidatus Woesearchaeota archaeon]